MKITGDTTDCGKSLVYAVELPQKFNFQTSTTKPDNKDHPTVKTRQI